MKKNISVLHVILFATILSFGAKAQTTPIVLTQLWTLEEVKMMAKEYNFKDSISWTRRNVLMCMTKEQIIKYFKKENEVKKSREEVFAFLEKTKYVRNYQDYYKLVEIYPSVKKSLIKLSGNETNYLKQKDQNSKGTYRIYRAEKGSLIFIESNNKITTAEQKYGQRIDILPKE